MAPRSAYLLFAILSITAVSTFAAAIVGGWEPIKDLSDPTVTKIAKFAVAEHNKVDVASLVFVSVVKGEMQVVAGVNYRLIISAKDGGTLNSYSAVVYEPLGDKPPKLVSFVKLLKN